MDSIQDLGPGAALAGEEPHVLAPVRDAAGPESNNWVVGGDWNLQQQEMEETSLWQKLKGRAFHRHRVHPRLPRHFAFNQSFRKSYSGMGRPVETSCLRYVQP